MGHIGITMLIISGLYLMTPFWMTLSARPLLIAKLILVLVLTISIIVTSVSFVRNRNCAAGCAYIQVILHFTSSYQNFTDHKVIAIEITATKAVTISLGLLTNRIILWLYFRRNIYLIRKGKRNIKA